MPPSSPVRAASSTSAIARGKIVRSRGTSRPLLPVVAPYIAPSIATFASARVVDGAALDDAGVEVAPPRRIGHRRVARHAGQHARLELRHVRDDERPAGVGAHRGAQLPGQLQRSAAGGRPPPGDDAARHVDGPEAAVVHPRGQPRPTRSPS